MTPRVVVRSRSAAESRRIGEALGRAIDPVPRAGFLVVLLGDLGAGKTTFAGGLLRGLGVPADVPVVSPTFTVARAYRGRVPVHHVDAYMVRRTADLEAAGFEIMGGDGEVTCVEWGDRVADALPPDRLEVTLTPEADPLAPPMEPPRRLELTATGSRSARVLERFARTVGASLEGAGDPS